MIAKHIAMRAVKKSDFYELVEYLNNPQNKQERVGRMGITNCLQNNPLDAALEIQATQALNKRAETDKTYHLLISFKAGENPSQQTLEAIEARLCAALGYVDHQRISAVHHDTDNLHIHVAINKIHPIRHTILTPYRDYKILGDMCVKLEKEYDLEPDNHKANKTRSENRADDMERHAGVESLLNWIKHECAQQMHSAKNWAELHEIMRGNNLELRLHGNGLVVTNTDGLGVKASSVSREFGKARLEQRLGIFETSKNPSHKVIKNLFYINDIHIDNGNHYDQLPIFAKKIDTVELYAQYKSEQQNLEAERNQTITQARAKKDQLIKAAKHSACLKRIAIKNLQGQSVEKKLLYAIVIKSLRAAITKIKEIYLNERHAAYTSYHRLTWADWLKTQAIQGNSNALTALRAREIKSPQNNNAVGGHNIRRVGQIPGLKPDNITKAGTIIYRVGSTAIRDDGDLLSISRGASEHGLEAALRMAIYRYGNLIKINGSPDFKEQILQIAVTKKLNITFDDIALEQHRQRLVHTLTTKEQHNDRVRTDPSQNDRRRRDRSRVSTVTRVGDGQRIRSSAKGNSERDLRFQADINKPNLGRIGCQPPPVSQNRLRNLSQLSVVQLTTRSEVLLPSDVSSDMEHKRTQRNNGMRRDVPGSRAIAAAEKYIVERQEKIIKGIDIQRHRKHNEHDVGTAQFAGLRQIEGESLALLKRNDEIIVLPIDVPTLRRMKRLSLGDEVMLTAKGVVKTKGRGR